MRSLDLFAGAGGSLWAGQLLGWRCVAAVEVNKHCQRVLQARQDDGSFERFQIFGDIREFGCEEWRGCVDVITAGFPCQPFSGAGKQRGVDDERNMWSDTARCIRQVRPGWIFLENVPALLTSGYYTTVLSDLASLGFDVAWGVLGGLAVGAPHKRERLWIVGRNMANADRLRQLQQAKAELDKRDGVAYCGQTEDLSDAVEVRTQRGERGVAPARESKALRRCSWWEDDPSDTSTQPSMARMVYGATDRINRTNALGDGWIPAVAVEAWHQLSGRLMG